MHYKPWRGDHYKLGYDQTDKKLLICGLTHYDDVWDKDWTFKCLNEVLALGFSQIGGGENYRGYSEN